MGEAGGRGFRDGDEMKGPAENVGTVPRAGRSPARRFLTVGRSGRITLPPDLAKKAGAAPGAKLEVTERDSRLEIRPDIHSLSRLYIEPTSRCNLACRTCVRNTWAEPLGDMARGVFRRLASSLRSFPFLESVMFAGLGEPTAHPDILRMIRSVKRLGLRAEITTNGTGLDAAMVEGLLRTGLDTLWVSFDGAEGGSFEAIRRGARFEAVVESLRQLRGRPRRDGREIQVGISFVVLRRNVEDLSRLDELARMIGASKVIVSNVLPYSAEMEKEMVCGLTLSTDTFTFSSSKTEVRLPRLDINPATRETILRILRGYENLTLMGNPIFAETSYCRFVAGRTAAVRWDGVVTPCLGLLHEYTTYLNGNERKIRPYPLGDLRRTTLDAIWDSGEYRAFRERVRDFDFSPCHVCGGCGFLDSNAEDCFGNAFPACGGCLWAQGVIQCP